MAVEMQNLNKAFGKIPILRNFSFSTRKGEIFRLPGSNGAGLTTTIRLQKGE